MVKKSNRVEQLAAEWVGIITDMGADMTALLDRYRAKFEEHAERLCELLDSGTLDAEERRQVLSVQTELRKKIEELGGRQNG